MSRRYRVVRLDTRSTGFGSGMATVEWVVMNFEFARLLGSGRRRIRRLFANFGIWSACLLLAIIPDVVAQVPAQIAKPGGLTPYPRTNLATGYEVVSSWPAVRRKT